MQRSIVVFTLGPAPPHAAKGTSLRRSSTSIDASSNDASGNKDSVVRATSPRQARLDDINYGLEGRNFHGSSKGEIWIFLLSAATSGFITRTSQLERPYGSQ